MFENVNKSASVSKDPVRIASADVAAVSKSVLLLALLSIRPSALIYPCTLRMRKFSDEPLVWCAAATDGDRSSARLSAWPDQQSGRESGSGRNCTVGNAAITGEQS